jgi:hypothetical protein
MRPDALFVPFAPSLLRRAPSFRSAEAIFESGILPLAEWYSLSDVQAILVAWHENNQCVMAGAMPGNAAQLFEATRSLLPDSLDAWRDFLQQVRAVAGGSTYYHYPTLEGLVRDASTD